jgi:hypothetical protein
VQYGAHLIGGQVNIRLTIVTLHKAVAITVARNNTLELSEEARRCAGNVLSCFNKKSL